MCSNCVDGDTGAATFTHIVGKTGKPHRNYKFNVKHNNAPLNYTHTHIPTITHARSTVSVIQP